MLVLRCTVKLLKELGCEPACNDDVEKAHGLNVWFVNLLRFDRRKCSAPKVAKESGAAHLPEGLTICVKKSIGG
jgi:hypothetical protein